MKRLFIAGIALLTVPATILAQDDKDKVKEKEKKDLQHITITRSGDINTKTVIEIDGDKIKINGKDVKDIKDVQVHVNKINGANVYRVAPAIAEGWNFNMNDDDHMSLFSEDENRAMLGVVTEGHEKGAEIQSVTKASAAEKAGLKKNDIITKIDNREIESTDDVTEAIRAHKPGDKVNVSFLREGKEQKVTAELGKWKGIKMNAMAAPRMESFGRMAPMESPMVFDRNGGYYFGSKPKLGLSIQDTDEGVGVKVLDVDDESNAAKAGIKEGDIIVGIDDHEVKGTDDVTKTIRDAKDKYNFNFKINRDGKTQTIKVNMPRKLKTADL